MDNNEQEATRPIRLQGTLWWYLLCAATIFGLMVAGSECGGIVYCYGDSRDLWWHPTKILGSLVFALFLPIPHISVALFFQAKRNLAAILRIARGWYKIVGLLLAALIVLGFLSAQLGQANERRLNVGAASERLEREDRSTGRGGEVVASSGVEAALISAITCASLKKKLGRVDDAVKINGYVIYKFTEINTPQDVAQSMIFDAVGKANAIYAENHENLGRVQQIEHKYCSIAKGQLPDLPVSL